MPILQVDLPIPEFNQLTRLAGSAGAKAEDLGARILTKALQTQTGGDALDDLRIRRAIAGVCADRSPWNNEVDTEWDDWQSVQGALRIALEVA